MKKGALFLVAFGLFYGYLVYRQYQVDQERTRYAPTFAQTPQAPVILDASMIDRDDLHYFVNAHRVDKGREKLVLNQPLNKSAMSKCKHMAKYKYWDHNAHDGTEPWYWIGRAGINYNKAGENLAFGQYSAYEAVAGWKESRGHNKNLLDRNFTLVGYAVCNATDYNGLERTVITVQHLAEVI